MDTCMFMPTYVEQGEFQWGHGFSAMDTMLNSVIPFLNEVFQWGHDFSAMDTWVTMGGHMDRFYMFRWGHGFSAMDTFSWA